MRFIEIFETAIYSYSSSTTHGSTSPAIGGVSALMHTSKSGVIALLIMLVVAAAVTAITASLVSRISSHSDRD